MAARIKARAKTLGINLVGITRYDQDSQLQGVSFGYKYAICLGHAMDREEML